MHDKNIFLESILKAVPIRCNVTGEEIECSIRQEYVNTFSLPLEVVYAFPTPDRAAVTGLTVTVGERRIETEIMESEEARRDYAKQIVDGNSAFLLESERPNVNRLTLGRVEPGERIVAETRFSMTADVVDSAVRISIPTAIAPRYLPCRPVDSPSSSQSEWDVNPPFGETGYMVEFEMTLDPLREIVLNPSPSHPIIGRKDERNVWHIGLSNGCCEADRDLVVTYRYTQREARNTGVLSADGRFLLAQFFPEFETRRTVHTAFSIILDCSGSMDNNLTDAKSAIREAANHFQDGDSFQIICFHNRVLDLPCSTMRPVNAQTVRSALSVLERIQAGGGTEMMEPLRLALSAAPSEQRHCVLLITDGQVGNDRDVIAMVQKERGQSTRLFPVGIGFAANSYLVNELADVGRGVAEHVCPGEAIGDKIERQMIRCAGAHVDGAQLAWANDEHCSGQEPPVLPELFDGEAVRILLPVDETAVWPLTLSGSADGNPWSCTLNREDAHPESGALVGKMWARTRLRRLERDYDLCGNDCVRDELKRRAVALSIESGVLSRWTTYYSALLRKDGDMRMPVTHRIPVAVAACRAAPDNDGFARDEMIASLLASPVSFAESFLEPPSREWEAQFDAQWRSIVAAGGYPRTTLPVGGFYRILHRLWLRSISRGSASAPACANVADVLRALIGNIPHGLLTTPAYFDIWLLMIDHCLGTGAFRDADTDQYVVSFFRALCMRPGTNAPIRVERAMVEFCLYLSRPSPRFQAFERTAHAIASHCHYELEATTPEKAGKAALVFGRSILPADDVRGWC